MKHLLMFVFALVVVGYGVIAEAQLFGPSADDIAQAVAAAVNNSQGLSAAEIAQAVAMALGNQGVGTSPPQPIGTNSGDLLTLATQHADIWHLIFLMLVVTLLIIWVVRGGQAASERRVLEREINRANTDHVEKNQEALQLQSDNGFLRDQSADLAEKNAQLVRDVARELLNQSKRGDELEDLVKLTKEPGVA